MPTSWRLLHYRWLRMTPHIVEIYYESKKNCNQYLRSQPLQKRMPKKSKENNFEWKFRRVICIIIDNKKFWKPHYFYRQSLKNSIVENKSLKLKGKLKCVKFPKCNGVKVDSVRNGRTKIGAFIRWNISHHGV